MILGHKILVFFHISLWVFWLGSGAEKLFEKTNMPFSLLLCVGALAFALATQTAEAFAAPAWLTIKLVAVGLIGFAVVPLDRGFAPATMTFATIAGSGTTPELEQQYHAQLQPVYGWVLFIYAMTILAAFSGTVFGP